MFIRIANDLYNVNQLRQITIRDIETFSSQDDTHEVVAFSTGGYGNTIPLTKGTREQAQACYDTIIDRIKNNRPFIWNADSV